jgi:hypothetical protein
MKVEYSVVISRPAEEVFAFAGNPDNDPKWGSLIVASRQLSPGPVGVGTRFQQMATFLGARVNTEIEITAYAPGESVCYRASHPVAIEHCRSFEAVPEGTRLTFCTEIDARGRLPMPISFLKTIARRQMEADMDEIKSKIEGSY